MRNGTFGRSCQSRSCCSGATGTYAYRWPGGCFADEYHWREGIGPQKKRPVKVNTHWGGVTEPNTVGTHEFFELLRHLRRVDSRVHLLGLVPEGPDPHLRRRRGQRRGDRV